MFVRATTFSSPDKDVSKNQSKSFSNLSSTYKTLIRILNNDSEFQNIDENSTLQQLNALYLNVDSILKEQDLQIADINHLMENYTKQNERISRIYNALMQ